MKNPNRATFKQTNLCFQWYFFYDIIIYNIASVAKYNPTCASQLVLCVLRWQDVVQELQKDQTKTRETVSLWQQYSHLYAQCSAELQKLQGHCEDLRISAAQPDTRAALQSAQVSVR